jgi:uncharacterized protein DUF1996
MNPRRVVLIAALSATIGASLAIAGSAALAGDTHPSAPMNASRASLAGVNFISSCRFSHRRPDDPIVFPAQAGASHDHSFVGNRTTSAFSTVETLLAAGTSCQRAGDTAAYWVPTLYANGHPVAPLGATIYYRRRSLEPVQAFPSGLKMIAGDSHSSMPQQMGVTYWNCGAAIVMPPSSTAPTCPLGRRSGLRLHVNFPSCWDGKRLDSPDHQSHMAYSMRGRACPASHPVPVPAISLIYRYPVVDGSTVALSSGGQYSGHADFVNAWNQGELTRLVDSCLNALRRCERGD